MTAEPTRRAMLSAGAAAIMVAPVVAAEVSSSDLAELAAQLDAAATDRYHAMLQFRQARRRVAAWDRAHPRPDYSGDGRALLAWLEAYRAAIEGSGARHCHVAHEAACRAHEAVANSIAATSRADGR